MAKAKDITGQRFGRLVAIKNTEKKTKSRVSIWLCECDCGNKTEVFVSNLTNESTKSCGCLSVEGSRERHKKLIKYVDKNLLKEGTNLSFICSDKPNKNNCSGVKGVCWDNSKQMWKANLMFQGKTVLSKRFENKQDAINARKEAEEKYFKPILEKYGKDSEGK